MTNDEFQVTETMDLTFFCIATGLPAPIISYLKESDQLGSSRYIRGTDSTVLLGDGIYQVMGILILTNATDENTGNVTCQATNTVRELNQTRMDSTTVNLVVNSEQIKVQLVHGPAYSIVLVNV